MARWVGHQPPWGHRRTRADYGLVARWLLWPLLALWDRLFYTDKPPLPRPNTTDNETLAPQWKAVDSNWRYTSSLFFLLGPPGAQALRLPAASCRCGGCPLRKFPLLPPVCAGHILYNIWVPVLVIGVVAGVSEAHGIQSNLADNSVASDAFSMVGGWWEGRRSGCCQGAWQLQGGALSTCP